MTRDLGIHVSIEGLTTQGYRGSISILIHTNVLNNKFSSNFAIQYGETLHNSSLDSHLTNKLNAWLVNQKMYKCWSPLTFYKNRQRCKKKLMREKVIVGLPPPPTFASTFIVQNGTGLHCSDLWSVCEPRSSRGVPSVDALHLWIRKENMQFLN